MLPSWLDAAVCSSSRCVAAPGSARTRPQSSQTTRRTPHAARVAVSSTALTDSRPPSAPCAQSDAVELWPLQQRCSVMRPKQLMRLGSLVEAGAVGVAAPCRGERNRPCALGARFACSSACLCRWGSGVWVSEYVRTRLYACILALDHHIICP